MTDKDSANNKNYVSHVKILDVEKRYKSGPKHYVYVIQVTWSNPANTFIIYRRYAQFFDLQCKLLNLFAEAPSPSNNSNREVRLIPFLPGKIFIGRSQIRQIALERKSALDAYCQKLISLPERISRSRPIMEFFQPLPTDLKNPTETKPSPHTHTHTHTLTPIDISAPVKLPTYRCFTDFTAVEKTEISLKRNTIVKVIDKHLNGWWFVQDGDRKGFVPGAFLDPIEEQNDVRPTDTFSTSINETYLVNKSYQTKHRDEISLDQGSFITVLEKSFTGWWIVKFNDITGRFPAIYLTSCKGLAIPDNVPKQISTIPSQTSIQRGSSLNTYDRTDSDEYVVNTKPELFVVHTDFMDTVGDCASLQRGDTVEIHEKHSSGWWLGRRSKDANILTWIPSAFLQKEPIFDTYTDEMHNPSSHSPIYSNVATEEQVRMNDIYQNIGYQVPNEIIYIEVLKKEQPIAVSHPSLPSNNDNENVSTKTSVRDLVKKFNHQE